MSKTNFCYITYRILKTYGGTYRFERNFNIYSREVERTLDVGVETFFGKRTTAHLFEGWRKLLNDIEWFNLWMILTGSKATVDF